MRAPSNGTALARGNHIAEFLILKWDAGFLGMHMFAAARKPH